MPRIKVVHIITKLELGGAQGNTLYTVENLDRERFEPVLVCGCGGILDAKAEALEQEKNIKVYFVKPLVRELLQFIRDPVALFRIFRILKKEKPDIVHTHSSKAGILGRWAARLAGVPHIVHTYHGFGFHDFMNPLKKWFYIAMEWLTSKITGKFIGVSRENINTMIKYRLAGEKDCVLIHSGIRVSDYRNLKIDKEQKRSELRIPSGDKVVTTVGPFKPQKNLVDFIRVAWLITREIKSIRFLVIGDGMQRPLLEQRIKDLRMGKRMMLLGWRHDIAEILAVTDIFVMTSLWEGLPRSILEAMSSGRPVVANAVDGVREVVEDNVTGFLVEPGDVNTAAERIKTLLKDPTLTGNFGKIAASRMDETFDIDYMVRQQEELYVSLAAGIPDRA